MNNRSRISEIYSELDKMMIETAIFLKSNPYLDEEDEFGPYIEGCDDGPHEEGTEWLECTTKQCNRWHYLTGLQLLWM